MNNSSLINMTMNVGIIARLIFGVNSKNEKEYHLNKLGIEGGVLGGCAAQNTPFPP
jgi:hypothetical protein